MYTLTTSDLISGIFILAVSVPHAIWSLNKTVSELKEVENQISHTVAAILAITFLFLFLSNLYILCWISVTRLFVIFSSWKERKYKEAISLTILCWILALVVSITPTWAPTMMTIAYEDNLLLYSFSVTRPTIKFYLLLVAFLIFPFIMMLCSSLASFMYISRFKLYKLNGSILESPTLILKERNITKYISLTVFGFSCATLPFLIYLSIANSLSVSCFSNSAARITLFIIFSSRSLVNLLINYKYRNFFHPPQESVIFDNCSVIPYSCTRA